MISKRSIFRLNSVASVLVTAGLLSACGGSGGSDSTYTFTVTAIDGYLANAEVYAGTTYSGGCAVNDYLGMTNETGKLPGIENSYLDIPLCVKALPGVTVDLTRGDIASSFELTAPAGYQVVTPITHMVQQAIQSDGDIGLSEAEDMVVELFADLGVSEEVLFGDYIAAGEESEAAQAVEIVAEQLADFNDESLDVQMEIAESLAESTAMYIADETLSLDDYDAYVEVSDSGEVIAEPNVAPTTDTSALPTDAELIELGNSVTAIDLTTVFSDENGEDLTYTLTIEGATEAEAGLNISDEGMLTGTPTALGDFTATIVASDKYEDAPAATLMYSVVEEIPDPTECTGFATTVIDAAYDDYTNDGNGPENTIDGDLTSRWSSLSADSSDGKWLVFDLGEARDIVQIETAWSKPDQRTFTFDLEYSLDGTQWMPMGDALMSTDQADYQVSWTGNADGQYVRLTSYGNSSSGWNSLYEVRVSDCGETGTPSGGYEPPEAPIETELEGSSNNTQYAKFTDTDSGDTSELRYKLDSSAIIPAGKVTASFSKEEVLAGSSSKDAYMAIYGTSTSSSNAIVDLRIKNGSFEIRDADFDVPYTFTMGDDEWYDVEIEWDATSADSATAPLVSVSINGSPITNDAGEKVFASFSGDLSAVAGGVQTVIFKVGDNSSVTTGAYYVDDFVLSDASGTEVFSDDFEGYALGDSLEVDPYDSATHEVVVDGAEPSEGGSNKVAVISDTMTSDAGELRYQTNGALAEGKLTASFLVEAGKNKSAYIGIFGASTSTSDAVVDLNIGSSSIKTRDGMVSGIAYDTDTWVDVDITWTTTQITLTIGDNAPETYTPANMYAIENVIFKLGDNGNVETASFLIDDFVLYSDAAGTTVDYSDDFESYADGTDLDAAPYHSNTNEAVVEEIGGSDANLQAAEISDTMTSDAGELRYGLASALTEGKLTASFLVEAGKNKSAYIGIFGASTSTSDAVVDLNIGSSSIKTRDGMVTDIAYDTDTWIDVEISWTATEITLTIGDNAPETYTPANMYAIENVIFKLGDNGNVETASFLVDDFVLTDAAGTEVFSDNFESYAAGTDLDADPYHSNTNEAVVIARP